MIARAEHHDRLKFPRSLIPESERADWETVPELEAEFQPAIVRIAFLAREGLTS